VQAWISSSLQSLVNVEKRYEYVGQAEAKAAKNAKKAARTSSSSSRGRGKNSSPNSNDDTKTVSKRDKKKKKRKDKKIDDAPRERRGTDTDKTSVDTTGEPSGVADGNTAATTTAPASGTTSVFDDIFGGSDDILQAQEVDPTQVPAAADDDEWGDEDAFSSAGPAVPDSANASGDSVLARFLNRVPKLDFMLTGRVQRDVSGEFPLTPW